ncbi:protoporphyrinogen oxidase HemJ [Pseudohongiella spirulinae]|uniref:Protoporphyrinogen IX oxidase n=1 Tax=Pseudohongiella spirulinae TaxID=1249552 RepID=A0A0S2KG13_9GAMM|nr:protoporphyrinogen oxidase HemJ [Pseudohongiella spirulinae]ALO47125.1 putative membrane protein [Pseudohongiella spirulinae]
MAWLEAFHIMSVITWFAGIFYLPRLFVYHAMSDDQVSKDRFVIMERKLFKGIMTPSAIATVLFGSWLIASAPDYYLRQGWLHAKLSLVVLLIIYHISCWWFMVRFREDRNTHSHKFFRFYNEAPVLVMIAVVILVVVKPF